jgi:hypothetical protein
MPRSALVGYLYYAHDRYANVKRTLIITDCKNYDACVLDECVCIDAEGWNRDASQTKNAPLQ